MTLNRNPLIPQQITLRMIESFHVMAEIMECIFYWSTTFSILMNTLRNENSTQMWEVNAADGDITIYNNTNVGYTKKQMEKTNISIPEKYFYFSHCLLPLTGSHNSFLYIITSNYSLDPCDLFQACLLNVKNKL